jgi:hypothetical protein
VSDEIRNELLLNPDQKPCCLSHRSVNSTLKGVAGDDVNETCVYVDVKVG